MTAFCANVEAYMPNLDVPLQWDFLKCRLKSLIQAYFSKAAAKHRRHHSRLQRRTIRFAEITSSL